MERHWDAPEMKLKNKDSRTEREKKPEVKRVKRTYRAFALSYRGGGAFYPHKGKKNSSTKFKYEKMTYAKIICQISCLKRMPLPNSQKCYADIAIKTMYVMFDQFFVRLRSVARF